MDYALKGIKVRADLKSVGTSRSDITLHNMLHVRSPCHYPSGVTMLDLVP